MYLRLPWILSRRRLLVAVTFDGVLFVTLYNFLFLNRFGRWPDGSIFLPILWVVWVLCSYVIGRYQGIDGLSPAARSFVTLDAVVKTMGVVVLSLAGTLAYLLFFKTNLGESLLRSFVIPFLGYFGICSFLVQSVLGSWVRSMPLGTDYWHYLGGYESFDRLEYHLKWSRIPAQLNYLSRSQLHSPLIKTIVVEDFSNESSSVIDQLLRLQQQGTTVFSRQAWCEAVLQRFPSEFLSNEDVLRGEFSLTGGIFQLRLKRLGDALLSAFLLILTSPFLFLLGLLIKLEDGGPVLYSQVRTGLYGNPFTIWKLRTMRIDAERDGAQWVKREDIRITNIGSFLRITRLDELPQLWCVFVGNMSLIGPRPERPEFDKELELNIPHYKLRQRMRPGLSGWAQVNYPYGASVEDAANKLSYDLYYLRNFTFWLDLLILFKTVRLVFNAQGAKPAPSSLHSKSHLN